MRPRRAIWCLLPGAWALACGGRYQQPTEGDDAPSAGTPSGGRPAGQAGGTATGGIATGGTATGGIATGGSEPICPCDPVACVPPFHAVQQVGGCCDYCELDLMQCAQASDNYQQLRLDMIDKYNSLGCMIDADCTIYYDQNQCGVVPCGFPLLASAVNEVGRILKSAQSSCSPACPGSSAISCKPAAPPRCVMGRCQ